MITNRVEMIGRLTKDCTYEVTPKGTPLAKFTLAVERAFKKNDEKVSDFFLFKAFSQKAEFIANNIPKGTLIAVEAYLMNDNYEREGNKVYRNALIVEEVKILSFPAYSDHQAYSKSQNNNFSGQGSPGAQPQYNQPQQNYGVQGNGGFNQQQQYYSQPSPSFQPQYNPTKSDSVPY